MTTNIAPAYESTEPENRYVEHWLAFVKDPTIGRHIADTYMRPLLLQTSFLVNAYWPGEDDDQSDEAKLLFPLFRDAILTALYTGYCLGYDQALHNHDIEEDE